MPTPKPITNEEYNKMLSEQNQGWPILDFEKIVKSKNKLYFTGGTYEGPGYIRTLEPAVFVVGQEYWDQQLESFDIYYDEYTNAYSITKKGTPDNHLCSRGRFMGGFLVNGCDIKFTIPLGECLRYVRAFSEEFDEGYDLISELRDVCNNWCGSFTFEFSDEFVTSCAISTKDPLYCNKPYKTQIFRPKTTIVNCPNSLNTITRIP